MYSTEKSILQEIHSDELKDRNTRLYLKRDDLIDEEVSGNKWRKLKMNIEQLKSQKKDGLLTFGGAFSNHLLATASSCHKAGIQSIGMVRGQELSENSNETLKRCAELGMKLVFISREEYNLRNDKEYWKELAEEYTNYYIVPEGGANFYGLIGCQDIIREVNVEFDSVFVAQGTTATSCGILVGLGEEKNLHVVPVLKGFDSKKEMRNLLNFSFFDEEFTEQLIEKVIVLDEYHFGGYASYTEELIEFIQAFHRIHGIPLDHVYTGKAMFALFSELKKGNLDNKSVLFIHTGGLQGVKFLEKKEGIRLW